MKRLAILGAGGHGKVVADTSLASGWDEVVFFDRQWPKLSFVRSWRVEGDDEKLFEVGSQFDGIVVAIGSNSIRLSLLQRLANSNHSIATIIHPTAWVSPYAKIGIGSVVFAGAVVQIDSVLGMGCIVNTSATIDHECILGDGVHVSPGAHLAGNVCIGKGSWIGIGASVKESTNIGNNVVIGAGSVVIRDLVDDLVAVGIPAMPIKQKGTHAQ